MSQIPSYKSVLDSLIEQSTLVFTAQIRLLKDHYKESQIAKLPLSADDRWTIIAKSKFIDISHQLIITLKETFSALDKEIQTYYAPKQQKEYEKPLKGTKDRKCEREQVKPETQKQLVIAQHNVKDYLKEIEFNQFKHFIEFEKKVSGVQNLTLNFQSQGMTDNNMGHFMSTFIKYHNLQSLSLNLGCNSLTTIGARQLAGCFTNLNQLHFLDISLYNNKITWEGIDAIMHSFGNLINLKELSLNISCNPISNKGFSILAKALPSLRKLQKLWLLAYDIGMNDESFKKFMVYLQELQTLLVLKIDFQLNPFDKKLINDLNKIIHGKKMNNFEILV